MHIVLVPALIYGSRYILRRPLRDILYIQLYFTKHVVAENTTNETK